MTRCSAPATVAGVLAQGLALVLVSAGCLSVAWTRETENGPPPQHALAELELERSDLDDALAVLGAPVAAWEWTDGGIALAWGWSREKNLGLSLSVPLYKSASASFNYDDVRAKLLGVVLFFDESDRLVQLREGLLGELRAASERANSAWVEG